MKLEIKTGSDIKYLVETEGEIMQGDQRWVSVESLMQYLREEIKNESNSASTGTFEEMQITGAWSEGRQSAFEKVLEVLK